ncbi:MAG: hypothetical protein HS111_18075 [Kofleriaceae bacterium]|nr:hypothetical protein [Kofleriaceae bacterium]
MWFDDHRMGIGSFLWYWLERTRGFSPENRCPHPARAGPGPRRGALDEAGGVAVEGEIARGPVRMALLYRWAQGHTDRPIKACVGAGPVQLSTLAHFRGGPVRTATTCRGRWPTSSRREIHELIAAGCRHVQLEGPAGRGCPTCPATRTGRGSTRSSTARCAASIAPPSTPRGTSAWAMEATSSRA